MDDLQGLRTAAEACTSCELYRDATQTVFGDGPAGASLVLVGEQPGDREDLAGEPFVGPAGKLLDRALRDAGIPRDEAYLTNVVKHFKFEARGKRRIHQRPTIGEIRACRPWLDAELRVIRPELVVTLGATAAQALLGSSFRVTRHRGEVLDWSDGMRVVPTVHPSAILRAPSDRRAEAFSELVADLRAAAEARRKS
ncbi:MAG: UdgX family uracil-DNA binding protein [Pseudonocardia sp.]|nr:UdgX family uracil-DNA binding protein [Pseudonocardia sp.]MBO0876419.1 UdgX family uracil-DNA binding protein [Pseudonocardia sp.]